MVVALVPLVVAVATVAPASGAAVPLRCSTSGGTVVSNGAARVFSRTRRRRYHGHRSRVTAFYACLRADRRVFRLRKSFGGALLNTPGTCGEHAWLPRLSVRYASFVHAGCDSHSVEISVWDLAARRVSFDLDLGEDVDPVDCEVSSEGAVAWVDDADDAVMKADGDGTAKIGRADNGRIGIRGTTLSWREGGAVRTYRLVGAAPPDLSR
jgi:hypothetical protein